MVAQSCAGRPSLFDLISESREILHNFIFPQETEETEEIGQEQVQPEPDDEDVVTDVDSIVNIPHRSHALLQVDGSAAALRRLQRELRNFQRSDSSKTGIVVEVNGDNLFEWNVYFFNFEGPLANDMRRMGVSTIDLRVNFPSMYPNRPPFIRVLRYHFIFLAERKQFIIVVVKMMKERYMHCFRNCNLYFRLVSHCDFFSKLGLGFSLELDTSRLEDQYVLRF